MENTHDTIVIGGGIIGLSVAWRLAKAGKSVAVIERGAVGSGASGVAAGMLAPVTEATFGEEQLLRLNLRSARMYPDFVGEVTGDSSIEVSLESDGTLFCAQDHDRTATVNRLFEYQRELGLDVALITAAETRALEGALSPGVRAATLARGDLAVDPRSLCEALSIAFLGHGGQLIQSHVSELTRADGGVAGVIIDDAERLYATHTILAAGCWSSQIGGLPAFLREAIRPVKGQTIRLRPPKGEPPPLTHIVRTDEVYLVPRANGELVVGATVEEKGFDTALTAGALHELLESAAEILPGVRDMEVTETAVGLRPGTRDNRPLIGAVEDGLIAATGHYRNGILLAPVTAEVISDLVLSGRTPDYAASFSPSRLEVQPA